jgi:hypothetical protein
VLTSRVLERAFEALPIRLHEPLDDGGRKRFLRLGCVFGLAGTA